MILRFGIIIQDFKHTWSPGDLALKTHDGVLSYFQTSQILIKLLKLFFSGKNLRFCLIESTPLQLIFFPSDLCT